MGLHTINEHLIGYVYGIVKNWVYVPKVEF
jgi:hypothetical protein